jgi:predicted DsbA family dithiol-disulfide isomerase
MHEMLFHGQHALADGDLRRYAIELGLEVARFDRDRNGEACSSACGATFAAGLRRAEVRGTPTLFIDGVVHRGGYDAPTLLDALAT